MLQQVLVLRETCEPEDEATQAVVQLCCCGAESGFHAERCLIGRPEGSCGMSRFLVHELL